VCEKARGPQGSPVALALFVALASLLAGCAPRVPSDVRQAVLRAFSADHNARIHSAQRVEPVAEDLAAGAEEIWCVSVIFTCWSCDYGEYRTCADNRLVRRIDDQLEVSPILGEEDRARWEARGCELLADTVGGY
jgi:hypothetical protein